MLSRSKRLMKLSNIDMDQDVWFGDALSVGTEVETQCAIRITYQEYLNMGLPPELTLIVRPGNHMREDDAKED